MAEGPDDNLHILRQRVTCPICYNIFTDPKVMPNCSHVLCLNCLTRYLKSKLPVNFPTCPICRKIITVSLREIHKFEPARAEEDIVALVRKFEMCGFCKKNKNPNCKCVECGKFMCDKCKSCHAELKPNHTLEAIIVTTTSSKPISDLCKRHDQTFDSFCIMCQTLMCLYCDKYEHAKCKDKYSNEYVLNQYNTGLLNFFVQESGDRSYSLKSGSLKRLVYVKEFAKESKKWLAKRKVDLDCAIHGYETYKHNLDKIVDKQLASEPDLKIRHEKIKNGINVTQDCAKQLQRKCSDLIKSKNDSEVARVALDMEQLLSSFFMICTDYNMCVRPLKLTLERFSCFRTILKTASSCKVNGSKNSFACILRLKSAEIEAPNIRSTITFDENAAVDVHSIRSGIAKRILEKNNSVYNRVVFVDKSEFENYNCFYHKYGRYYDLQMALNFSNRCTYIESPESQLSSYDLIEQSNLDVQKASWLYFGRRAPSCHPYSFYVEAANDDHPRICFRVGGENNEKYGDSDSSLFYISHFTNVYGPMLNLPFTTVHQTTNETSSVCLTAFIDKSAPLSGIETLFIYFHADIFNIHAISVNSAITKFNIVDALDPKHIPRINCHLITDELGIFTLCNATDDNEISFYTTYRSNLTTRADHENYISTVDLNEQYRHPIRLRCLNVDLLCYVKTGIYFVKRELEYSRMEIGKLTQNHINGFIEEEMIGSLKQTKLNVPIRSLKPLTLVENRNEELVLVCSVENTRAKRVTLFVIIYPHRKGTDAVELLEVENTDTPELGIGAGHGTVVDAEMDPDGNIMYVLQLKNGKNHCVFTKHFMP